MALHTKKLISGILATYLGILPSFGFVQKDVDAQNTREPLEEKITQEKDGKRVLTVAVNYDEEFEQAHKPTRILTDFDFLSKIFEKEKYRGEKLEITFNVNTPKRIESDNQWKNNFSLFKDFLLTTTKEADITVLFSNQTKQEEYHGLTDRLRSCILLNFSKNVAGEYLLLHEVRHLFGAADRDAHHPDYLAISNMSYNNPFTSAIDEQNKSIIFSNKKRDFNYKNKDRKELSDLMKKYPQEKDLIRRAYLSKKNMVLNGNYLQDRKKSLDLFLNLKNKHADEAYFDYALAEIYNAYDGKLAVQYAQSAIQKKQDFGDAYALLANILFRYDFRKCPELVEKAVTFSQDQEVMESAVWLYEAFGMYERAYPLQEKLLQENPFLKRNYFKMATLCQAMGRNNEADTYFTKTIEREEGEDFQVYLEAGGFYLEQGKYEKAISLLAVAEKLDRKQFEYFLGEKKSLLKEVPPEKISKKNRRFVKQWLLE